MRKNYSLSKLWVLLGITILICLFPNTIKGQKATDIKISGNYQNVSLEVILEDISKNYPLSLYYNPHILPDKIFNESFNEVPLAECLERLLTGTELGYRDYRSYIVFIANKNLLEQQYATGYYEAWEQRLRGNEVVDDRTIRIGNINELRPSGIVRLQGRIVADENKEAIVGARVLIMDQEQGTLTSEDGKFELEMPAGKHKLQVNFLGYEELIESIEIYSDGDLELALIEEAITLDEVSIEAEAPDANVSSVQLGITKINVQEMKKLPAFLGEVDVFQTLLLQAGVTTTGEGASGFHVRGGNADQNLIMLDDAFIFNASHALGFFSTFNSDLVGDATLYKGNIPAQYGGRLASVLKVDMKEGNPTGWDFKGGIGPVSSRLSLEGPIVKDKSSFIVGLRASYSDWILQLMPIPELKQSSAFFYDFNARYTHRFNPKDQLTLSFYSTQDDFEYSEEFGFSYGTQAAQLNFSHLFNDLVSLNTSAVYSRYQSQQSDLIPERASQLDNAISYGKLKTQLSYNPTPDLSVNGGLETILYGLDPGALNPVGSLSFIIPKSITQEQGLESAAFLQAEWSLSPAFSVSGGLRLSAYQYLGKKDVFIYGNDGQIALDNIVDTMSYSAGEVIKGYVLPEPRVAMRWYMNSETSIKLGYSRTTQYLNQIANTTTPTPTSIWQLSTPYIKPQRSHNYSVGIFRNFQDNIWESSIEAYYRDVDQWFDYKDFAQLIANEHLETEILPGKGRAYGLELSIKKNKGTFNGWLSYTYSRTEKQVEGINGGAWYPANFDRPHDLSLVANIQFNQRHNLVVNFNYRTGRPLTVPVASYISPSGLSIPDYSLRNQWRIPDYHRLDMAYTIGRGYKKDRKFNISWTVSVYNVYGRRNAYSIYFVQKARQFPETRRLSILGNAFPALTFNFELL